MGLTSGEVKSTINSLNLQEKFRQELLAMLPSDDSQELDQVLAAQILKKINDLTGELESEIEEVEMEMNEIKTKIADNPEAKEELVEAKEDLEE